MDHSKGPKAVLKSIRAELKQCLKSFEIGDVHGSFTTASDLDRIWHKDRLRSLFAGEPSSDTPALSADQLEHLRRAALPLLSFAVFVGVHWKWFLSVSPRIAFLGNDRPDPDFKLALPQSKPALEDLLCMSLDRNDFDQQYYFVSPITLELTNESGKPVEIRGKRTLPIETQLDGPRLEEGSYGSVYFGRLNPEYVQAYPYDRQQAFRPDKPYAVAVKVFNRSDEARREIQNLTYLKDIASSPDCRHTISLHHAIVHHFADSGSDIPKPLVIFPFAALGNLWQFLNGERAVGDLDGSFQHLTLEQRFPFLGPLPSHTARFSKIATPLLEQCLALAEALRFLHCRIEHRDMVYLLAHMDLKPNNIIISAHPDYPLGIWKLADFGISVIRIKPLDTLRAGDAPNGRLAPATIDTTAQRRSSTYQAPEIELSLYSQGQEDQRVSVGRMSDIWSFGAILAEVLAFAVGGTAAFHDFHHQRRSRSGDHPRVLNDYFWEWTHAVPSASPPTRQPRELLQVQQPSPHSGSTASEETYSKTRVRDGVIRWLQTVEVNNPACAAWVSCIKQMLNVYPTKRPSAEEMFLIIQNVLYPPRPRNSDDTGVQKVESSFPNAKPTEAMENHEMSTHHRPEHAQEGVGRVHNHQGAPLAPTITGTSAPRWPPTIAIPPGAGNGTPMLPPGRGSITSNLPGPSWHSPPDPRRPDADIGDNSIRSKTSMSSSVPTDPSTIPSFAIAGEQSPTKHEVVTGGFSVSLDKDRIVYLTKHKITRIMVLEIQPGPVNAAAAGPATEPLSSPHQFELPPDAANSKWIGVSVGGDYVVLYGHQKPSGRFSFQAGPSLIRILRLQRDSKRSRLSGGSWVDLGNDVEQAVASFDYNKRVTVSPTGLVAMVAGNGNELLILDASNIPIGNVVRLRPTSQAIEFEDVSFNENGALLYVSGLGGLCMLLAISTQLPDLPVLARATHKVDDLSIKEFQYGTQVFPHSLSLGCVVATKTLTRLLSCPLGGETSGSDGEMRPLGGSGTFEPRLRALTMHGSRLLLAVDKEGRLAEYPLTGRSTGHLGTRSFICTFDKSPEPGSQLRAYRYNEAGSALVILCHVGGKVEVLRFSVPTE